MMDRVLCVVLNKVDPTALRSIEHYKGDGFQNYYTEQKSVTPSKMPRLLARYPQRARE